MIDRFGNFFFVDPGSAWYPQPGQGNVMALFDLTFHAPQRYPLVSMGERGDSSVSNHVSTTHWVTHQPSAYASFNLGLFQPWHVEHLDAPALDVYLSEDAHNELRREFAAMGEQIPEQAHMKENVAADISNALKLFTAVFGETHFRQFSVTEIPYDEGVSFPGLIHLSWSTFQNTSIDGFDEFFRAHESAHQWFGNGVRPASYRDAWLSEGLATFCGLWYLEALKRRDTEYDRFLDQYKNDIGADQDAGPIDIGYRLSSPRIPRGYDVIVYEKGAWVFNMLRSLMTDLGTMQSERFTETMRDFYTTYRGGTASTDDFQRLVERHMGMPMGWFFDEWVRGTAIPSYNVTWGTEPADNGRVRIKLHITQDHVPADFRMPVLVAVDLGGGRVARFRVTVTSGQAEYTSPLIPGEPRSLTFNAMHSVLADSHVEH
jgi:aminopeptidase N